MQLDRSKTVTLEAAGVEGAPIDEPVVAHGPFVMNTVGEIKQAMLDFQTGKCGAIGGA